MSTSSPHIIILGAGLIGLCTADHLLANGASVTLIDSRSGPCEGTSFSNSGMIHPSQSRSWAPGLDQAVADKTTQATAELAQLSRDLLKEKMKALGLPDRPVGCVQIYESLDAARQMKTASEDMGVRAEITTDLPESFGRPACFFPDDLSGNAHDFGCALEAELMARGAKFLYGVDNFAARPSDGSAWKVMAGQARLSCEHLVIAAGPKTPEVLKPLGLDLTMETVSGVAVNFARPAALPLPRFPVMDAASRSALTVFEDHLRISGGWNATDPEDILPRWAVIAPGLYRTLGQPMSTWVGYRPVTPIGRPYISATARKNLWINTGHAHMGWTLSAGSGALMAGMILEGIEDDRFAFPGGV